MNKDDAEKRRKRQHGTIEFSKYRERSFRLQWSWVGGAFSMYV